MLLAARALTHLCDVLPSSCAAVVHYGVVPCFCARLLTIEYMDLAEQSLQALKKISQEHPTACLRAGALMAVLSYLDFFSTGVQRVALCTAANMCKKLPSDAADFVMEAIPLLTNLLHYHDAKVLEYASVCLTRIAEAFASSPDKLDELCHVGLVAQAAELISLSNSGAQASLSTSTYTGLIRLISTCASGSPLAARTLLLLGISGNLKDILSSSGLVANVSVHPALARPPEQVFDISFLQIFSPHELDYLLCGRRELWEPETLADHIKFDHGYTAKSPAIINLLEIMAEFTPEQHHAFCQFVTGAPRLPPGGLAALNPKLTIVRKHSSTTTNTASNGSVISESADDDLPSVMTCAKFLKLPPYSTKEIMYKKLLYAIYEGQGSFDLS